VAPAGRPAVHQPGVAGQAGVRADPEPLGHPGPEPLQQRVGRGDQVEDDPSALRVLEVDHHRAPAAEQQRRQRPEGGPGPVDPDHVRAEVGKDHRAERPRPDPGHLHHPHASKRPHASSFTRSLPPDAAALGRVGIVDGVPHR
jgi:hypothetical protein